MRSFARCRPSTLAERMVQAITVTWYRVGIGSPTFLMLNRQYHFALGLPKVALTVEQSIS